LSSAARARRVAEGAAGDDLAEAGAVHRIELAGLGLVDEIEQRRESVAEIEAAPATVTDIENAAQFRVNLLGIGEVRIPPVDGMPDRRVHSAFAHGPISDSRMCRHGGTGAPQTGAPRIPNRFSTESESAH